MGIMTAEDTERSKMKPMLAFKGGARELTAEPVMALSKSQVCRYPKSRSGATQMTKTATPMAMLASGALGRNEREGQERAPISALTMRKRTGYNHWDGSGIMRSIAM